MTEKQKTHKIAYVRNSEKIIIFSRERGFLAVGVLNNRPRKKFKFTHCTGLNRNSRIIVRPTSMEVDEIIDFNY